jgi:xylono-1,5-lactonase
MMTVEMVAPSACRLGEGALWSPARGELLWLDLADPALFRAGPDGAMVRTALPEGRAHLGTIALTPDPKTLLLADHGGLSTLDIATGAIRRFADPEHQRFGVSFNDGKVDRRGRLWIGSKDDAEVAPRGALWCLAGNEPPVLFDCGFVVSNGPAFSPDGTILYFSDSSARTIYAYELDGDRPRPRGRRVFAEMAIDEGYPDGITVDREGCLWVAHWDGWRVTRFSPAGERLTMVPLPVPRVTSVAFGGPSLDTLYITSAAYDLPAHLAEAAPLSGHVFALKPGVAGLPEQPFAGRLS